MRLYSGSARQFSDDTVRNQIADKLKAAFFGYFGHNPGDGEVQSWQNSLRAMQGLLDHRRLLEAGVMLEYQLPLSSKRLDCLVTGRDRGRRAAAVVVELKQWERCESCLGENEVITWVGGAHREVLHPSAQVGQYRQYLQDMHTSFSRAENPIDLRACSYLHNYGREEGDPIFAGKFARVLQSDPLFTKDDFDAIGDYLSSTVGHGEGLDVLADIEGGEYRPSKKLMDHVAGVIADQPEFILLDEQLIVFDKVLAAAREGMRRRKKQVVLVRGGPGTGKSVVAINLMGRLLKEGVNAHYATGSRAFTETLRKIIGTRGSAQFKYFNSYAGAEAEVIDVLICDEAHRIRRNSSNMYTPKAQRTDKPQIDELLHAARVSVYFIDDDQIVRPDEIGSSTLIRTGAQAAKAEVSEFELEAQFRCAGSDGFVNWVNNTLGVRRTANPIWTGAEKFDFRIVGSPEETEQLIRARAAEGHSARMTAGFCWPWSKQPRPDGLARIRRPDRELPAAVECAAGSGAAGRRDPEGDTLGSRCRRPRPGGMHLHGAGIRVRLRGRHLGRGSRL